MRTVDMRDFTKPSDKVLGIRDQIEEYLGSGGCNFPGARGVMNVTAMTVGALATVAYAHASRRKPRYTAEEIVAMRGYVWTLQGFMSYDPKYSTEKVERELHTYLANGTRPKELEAQAEIAKKRNAEAAKRYNDNIHRALGAS